MKTRLGPPVLHTQIRNEKRESPVKVRVIGGGGLTNTAKTKTEKRTGYSPESRSPIKPFSGEQQQVYTRSVSSPIKLQ